MAILTCALGALLVLAGLVALAMSVDLLPTEMGLFWGMSGVVLASSGAIVLAVAALIARIDGIVEPGKKRLQAPLKFAPKTVAPKTFAAKIDPQAPHVVGNYSVAGAQLAIYSDGSLEATFADGPRRFASMAEFRAFVEKHADAS